MIGMPDGTWLRDKGLSLEPPYFAKVGDDVAAQTCGILKKRFPVQLMGSTPRWAGRSFSCITTETSRLLMSPMRSCINFS